MNDLMFINKFFNNMIKDLDDISLLLLKLYIIKELDSRSNTICFDKEELLKWL